MPSIRVRCPHCQQGFRVRPEAAGTRGRCPNPDCRQVLRVPDISAEKKPSSDVPATSVPATKTSTRSARPSPSSRTKKAAAKQATPLPKRQQSSKTRPSKTRQSSRRASSSRRGVLSLLGVCVLAVGMSAAWVFMHSGTPTSAQTVAASQSPKKKKVIPPANYEKELKPFIQKYCSDCHGNGSQEGDFALDRYADLQSIQRDRTVWTKVLKLVELEAMPPQESDQPTPKERQQAVEWLNRELFYVDCSTEQNPGRVTVRRLNRTEYNNTVQDLLGIKFKPADDFPSDDVGHGFDNNGDVLTVPPLLIEKYLSAAETIAQTGARAVSPFFFKKMFTSDQVKTEGAVRSRGSESAFVSRGQISFSVKFPRAGQYELRLPARQDRAGKEDALMQVNLGKRELKSIRVKSTRSLEESILKFDAPAGTHDISVAFLNDFYDKKLKKHKDRNLFVGTINIEGPVDLLEKERSQIPLTKTFPGKNVSVQQAATDNLKSFLPKAFRRPVTDDEIQRYAGLVELASSRGASFEESMGIALQAILISPDFLFRVEGGRRTTGRIEMLDDFALASRLSYFLWSSCPDEELFQLAADQKLHQPAVLEAQTLRMLKDPRAQAFVTNFAGQWLGLRKLTTSEIDPDTKLFPDFNAQIRKDLWKETELFFASIVDSNSSIFELLTGKYTFLNERLAKYYGVPGVKGSEFRRVDLKDQHRSGVITQGSVLTLTSYPNRTSPVKRGQWVLEVLLNDAPPPPPPTVPALDQTSSSNPNLSFRESLELHRKDPNCAACHKVMDEIGFGLENFDAVGRWRTKEKDRPVDATGALPTGETFEGPDELVKVLLHRRDDFARALTEKVMTYAIGRGVEWYDECAIQEIQQELQKDDRFSTLILGVVNSAPFQARKLQETVAAGR